MQKALLLNKAVVTNNINLVNALLAGPNNVNIPGCFTADVNDDFDGITALYLSSFHKTEEITEILLKNGADLTMKTNDGLTALHSAGTESTVQILVDYGADLNDVDNKGCTPLHRICEWVDLKTIKCLVKNGANLKALDSDGQTPLMHALQRPAIHEFKDPTVNQVLPFLLEHSDVNVIDNHGNNILNFYKNMAEDLLISAVTHVVKLKLLNNFIHPSIFNTIANDESLNLFFTELTDELLKAKTMKFPNSWVSYFNLIVDSKKKLIKYAGNSNIVEDFDKNTEKIISMFPTFGQKMRNNFDKAIKNRKIWDKAAIVLSYHLLIFDPFHLIIRNILNSLSIKDLSILIK